ncbi:Transcriptional regulator PadR-like family protein [Corynebacterium ciconiae DSM 44920]|uniref:PadR family transcriptional regulator n=1 Tax=Corynebacterium ciconiae TaxID=227319 RepID=UPI000369992F|nr:PadR family transcriptional regulator [Corynebacterium ciconiae]WKD62175.1 Transcriptional regulator PadR-like family protein [Corynebacterium ciconiae DSM 44920]
MAESQLRKGAIELVVLGLLEAKPSYGGEVLERLRDEAGLEVSSGTIYPLLARLRKTALVATAWEESPVGPPRKIYKLTTAGRKRLTGLSEEWELLAQAVAIVTGKD